jgi:phosphopantetheinyl transferase (holo-ACP synthase)
MNDINAISSDSRTIRRLDVETPLGVVHLAGFVQKPDHRSVILGILSEYVGAPVTAADIVESKEDTRPKFPKLDFDVNWTHSDGYCVVAFGERGSLGLHIGVDLERFSPRRLHLAERFFSTEEAALVKSLTASLGEFAEHAAEREFFRLWCRKEAFYKCVGGEFFEGTLRRNMLKNPVHLDASDRSVYFVDLDGSAVGAPMKAALCLAVSA